MSFTNQQQQQAGAHYPLKQQQQQQQQQGMWSTCEQAAPNTANMTTTGGNYNNGNIAIGQTFPSYVNSGQNQGGFSKGSSCQANGSVPSYQSFSPQQQQQQQQQQMQQQVEELERTVLNEAYSLQREQQKKYSNIHKDEVAEHAEAEKGFDAVDKKYANLVQSWVNYCVNCGLDPTSKLHYLRMKGIVITKQLRPVQVYKAKIPSTSVLRVRLLGGTALWGQQAVVELYILDEAQGQGYLYGAADSYAVDPNMKMNKAAFQYLKCPWVLSPEQAQGKGQGRAQAKDTKDAPTILENVKRVTVTSNGTGSLIADIIVAVQRRSEEKNNEMFDVPMRHYYCLCMTECQGINYHCFSLPLLLYTHEMKQQFAAGGDRYLTEKIMFYGCQLNLPPPPVRHMIGDDLPKKELGQKVLEKQREQSGRITTEEAAQFLTVKLPYYTETKAPLIPTFERHLVHRMKELSPYDAASNTHWINWDQFSGLPVKRREEQKIFSFGTWYWDIMDEIRLNSLIRRYWEHGLIGLLKSDHAKQIVDNCGFADVMLIKFADSLDGGRVLITYKKGPMTSAQQVFCKSKPVDLADIISKQFNQTKFIVSWKDAIVPNQEPQIIQYSKIQEADPVPPSLPRSRRMLETVRDQVAAFSDPLDPYKHYPYKRIVNAAVVVGSEETPLDLNNMIYSVDMIKHYLETLRLSARDMDGDKQEKLLGELAQPSKMLMFLQETLSDVTAEWCSDSRYDFSHSSLDSPSPCGLMFSDPRSVESSSTSVQLSDIESQAATPSYMQAMDDGTGDSLAAFMSIGLQVGTTETVSSMNLNSNPHRDAYGNVGAGFNLPQHILDGEDDNI